MSHVRDEDIRRGATSDIACLWEASVGVLRRNDAGGWTKAAPDLYPHQWSWDSAFIAIGWAHIDPVRAIEELERLFVRQWATGKVPHIVFDDNAPIGSYFPDWTYWDKRDLTRCSARSSPHQWGVPTSGPCHRAVTDLGDCPGELGRGAD